MQITIISVWLTFHTPLNDSNFASEKKSPISIQKLKINIFNKKKIFIIYQKNEKDN